MASPLDMPARSLKPRPRYKMADTVSDNDVIMKTILDVVCDASHPLSILDVSKLTGYHRTTVRPRLLRLVSDGVLFARDETLEERRRIGHQGGYPLRLYWTEPNIPSIAEEQEIVVESMNESNATSDKMSLEEMVTKLAAQVAELNQRLENRSEPRRLRGKDKQPRKRRYNPDAFSQRIINYLRQVSPMKVTVGTIAANVDVSDLLEDKKARLTSHVSARMTTLVRHGFVERAKLEGSSYAYFVPKADEPASE